MDKTRNIFQIIKKMTKAEKRFFKLYSNLYKTKNEKKHLQLFDLINQTEEYDDKVLGQMLNKQFISSKVGNIKNYLKKNIFDSLKLFHRNTFPIVSFYDSLSISLILEEKDLYDESQKILEQQKKEVQKKSNLLHKLILRKHIFDLKRRNQKFKDFNQALVDYFALQEQDIKAYLDHLHMQAIRSEIILLNRNLEISNEEKTIIINKKINWLINKEKDVDKNIESQANYFKTLTQLYFAASDIPNYITTLESFHEFLQKNTNAISLHDQLIVYYKICIHYIAHENIQKFWHFLKYIEKITILMSKKRRASAICMKLQILANFYLNNITEALPQSFMLNTEMLIIDTSYNTIQHSKNLLTILVAQCYFVRKNYSKAQYYNHKVLLFQNIQPNNQIYIVSNILQIICYLELNDLNLAAKTILNLKRKLEREKSTHKPLKKLLTLITKLLTLTSKNKSTNDIFEKIRELIILNDKDPLFKTDLYIVKIWLNHRSLFEKGSPI